MLIGEKLSWNLICVGQDIGEWYLTTRWSNWPVMSVFFILLMTKKGNAHCVTTSVLYFDTVIPQSEALNLLIISETRIEIKN